MFEKMKERIKKDQLANDLIELGHQVKKTNEDVSANLSPTIGTAATKALNLIKSIEGHISDLVKSHFNKPLPIPPGQDEEMPAEDQPGEQLEMNLDGQDEPVNAGDNGIIDV